MTEPGSAESSPKPNAHTRPCLSTPSEASKTPAFADSLPNDWMVAGFSPHSEAHHTHPTMGLCHWGPLLPWEVCHTPEGHKKRCNDTTVRDIWSNGKSGSPQKPTLGTWATLGRLRKCSTHSKAQLLSLPCL